MAEVCLIDSSNIVNGSDLMKDNTNLTEWNSPLSKLKYGKGMFYNCTSLTSFIGDLSSLNFADFLPQVGSYNSETHTFNGWPHDWQGEIPDGSSAVGCAVANIANIGTDMFYNTHISSFITNMESFNFPSYEQFNYVLSLVSEENLTEDELDNDDILEILLFGSLLSMTYAGLSVLPKGIRLFSGSLESLVDGCGMFSDSYLTTIDTNLSSLKNGYTMFQGSELKSFDLPLPSIKTGGAKLDYNLLQVPEGGDLLMLLMLLGDAPQGGMFQNCYNLTSFTSNLSSLIDGYNMFDNCYGLTSFDADLSSLTNGYLMFYGCYSLTSFNSKISQIEIAEKMFKQCKLDQSSLYNIANNIKDMSSFKLGERHGSDIYINLGSTKISENQMKGYIDIDCASSVSTSVINECGNILKNKGWIASINNTNFLPQLSFDITEQNGFICGDNGFENGLTFYGRLLNIYGVEITSVVDEVAYNGSERICLLDTSNFRLCQNFLTGNKNFTKWDSPLDNAIDCSRMFYNCYNLTSFNSNLSNLIDAEVMFQNCYSLTSFDVDLSSLEKASVYTSVLGIAAYSGMFENCYNLTSFNSNLSSLTNGVFMFKGCSKLTTFNGDLSSLTNGVGMFYGCTALTSFTSNLSSLEVAEEDIQTSLTGTTYKCSMFSLCKLDAASVKNIINSLPSTSGKTMSIGIGSTSANADSFASQVGYSNMSALTTAFRNKGWTVTWQYRG